MTAHELQVQDPVRFPLPPLEPSTIDALHKAWERQDLKRYLQRWKDGYVPPFPEAFWSFSWRACDVGSGFGKFSLEQSALWPSRAYLAIDKGNRRGEGMCKRFSDAARPNLFGLHGNAIPILASMPPQSLDLLTIFYPNPWWPTKHRKKRWSYHSILPRLFSLLKPNGCIMLCANEAFYLSEWHYTLCHHPDATHLHEEFVGPVERDTGRSHFEEKFLQHHIPCGEIRFRSLAP